jgi:hypothetical protein
MVRRKEAALASLEGDRLTAAQAALDDFKAQAKTLKSNHQGRQRQRRTSP